ncbi:MAG: pyruvate kinase [Legionellales bacterium]|nr:MAG: pyruvate kinase [Legionellales bacterium]
MLRRTKIIATLGPATDRPEVLSNIIKAGVDLVRINLSHGTHAEHKARIITARDCAKKQQRIVEILLDLQGPKIRVARFSNGFVMLQNGAKFILDADFDIDSGTEKIVAVDYKKLAQDLSPQDILLLDDGKITLKVTAIEQNKIICTIIKGGKLSNNKGINKQGGGLSARALTAKDKKDIKFAAAMQADHVAVSFPKTAADIDEARELLKIAGSNASIMAKIERTEAMQNLDEIINAVDSIMVARGDLGIEIGLPQLPAAQKHIIARARALNKFVATATQMMESMIVSPIPTRAEVSDVANAVLDGTCAVTLSAETAVGVDPVAVVVAMRDICIAAEQIKNIQERS